MLLLKCGNRLELENQLCDLGEISATKVYDLLRTRAEVRPWMKAIWKSYIPPRYSFCAWLIFRNRIPTKTSLHFIAMENRSCELCHKEEETGQHLFFSCETSTLIWNAITSWLEIAPALSTLDRALTWLRRLRNYHCSRRKMIRLAILSTAYHIWRLRNGVYFDNQAINIDGIVCKIKVGVFKVMNRVEHHHLMPEYSILAHLCETGFDLGLMLFLAGSCELAQALQAEWAWICDAVLLRSYGGKHNHRSEGEADNEPGNPGTKYLMGRLRLTENS
ncbi:unnamed protein product [Cuscuta campestris]|uniref:Reverse transcriptase zinc-binding domain-containing protein n=1 Tax=Cuscuta campestris TaxID=132261 RepID=A0A484MPZ4_9ASTE|nr:unnamed protein product [Cuscuta campestris]